MKKICRRTYNNEAISEEYYLCPCEDICTDLEEEYWLEYDREKEYNEMKQLEKAVQDGTDIYPDSFY